MLESPSKKNLVIRTGAFSSVLVFSFLTIYAVSADAQIITVAMPTVLALLGLYIFVLAFSTVETNEKHITITTPHGQYQMRWDEIKQIEKSISDHQFKLVGKDKHLIVNLTWAPKRYEDVISMIEDYAKKVGIEIQDTIQLKEVNFNTRITK